VMRMIISYEANRESVRLCKESSSWRKEQKTKGQGGRGKGEKGGGRRKAESLVQNLTLQKLKFVFLFLLLCV